MSDRPTPETDKILAEWENLTDMLTDLSEHARKLERERDEAREAMAWRPIETAPVNQSVLVWLPNCEHYGDPVYRAILVDMGTGRRWTITGLSMGRDLPKNEQPTHWMPLPQPPEARSREGGEG